MNKKIVKTLGLASVLGASTAMGATVVGGASQPLLTIGTQTLTTGGANVTTGTGANLGKIWYNITDNSVNSTAAVPVISNALDMKVTPGFSVALSGTYYMRMDLTNAIIKTAPSVAAIGKTWGSSHGGSSGGHTVASLASQGAAGASTAIYLMTNATSGATTTDFLTIPMTDIAALGTATATTQLSFYSTLAAATNATAGTNIGSKTQPLLAFADVVTPTATASAVGTSVSSNFVNYSKTAVASNASTTDASIGRVTNALSTASTMDRDGTLATLADAYLPATSTMTLTGDLSVGTWFMDTTNACPLAGPTGTATIAATQKLTLNAAKTSGTISGTIFDASSYICNVIDGVSAIPAGAYTVGITYAPAGAGDLALTWAGGSLGSISRNGTTNQINYLTTFTGYNQKVILTNRSTVAGTYAFTFQTETDTTAVAGTAATGTLPASSVTVIKVADLVTLTGKSRASATFTAVLAAGNVGVATTQVNLSDGATDTVTYRN